MALRLRGRLVLSVFLVSLSMLVSCGPKAVQKDFQAAAHGVDRFHSQLDAGEFSQIYSATDPELRSSTNEADFTQLLQAVHRKLGGVKSERQVGFSERWSIGEGTLTRLDYDTVYEQGEAKEHFVWRPGGSGSVLVGYRIDSQALIVR